ncbi:MAG: copper resistance D family protein [Vicinamibacterales bacterium]
MESWLEIGAKAVEYAATLLLVGAVGLRWVLVPQVRSTLYTSHSRVLRADAEGIFLGAAALLIAGLALRVVAHTVAAFGFEEAWRWENLRVIAVESRWGGGWQRQCAVGALVLATAMGARRLPALIPVTSVAAIAFCFVLPLLGHAAGEPSRVAIHGLHVLAAGLWVGTLSCMLIVRSDESRAVRAVLLQAFAPLAMGSVGFLLASGVVAARTYLDAWSNLWTTEYGRLLLLKLAGVALVLALGAANWWRMHRAGKPPHARLARAEMIAAGLVVAVTAWLTETAHP